MTNEQDFHDILDKNPDDHHTRLVFADWLEEHGDPRAAGYRALGKLRIRPERTKDEHGDGGTLHFFGREGASDTHYLNSQMPSDWFDLIKVSNQDHQLENWKWLKADRRQAEDAAALAFSKLPPERQQELLASPVLLTRKTGLSRRKAVMFQRRMS